ncbi:MAG: hypothetical protein JO081_17890, partial [Alphaproteobacteria bacterium]|nr:hypothetical protein [Alphaproteobacteria bacterium]
MITAWQYGLLPPLDWDEECEQEMVLQVTLWNQLVRIETARRAAEREALVDGEPALAALWDEFDRVLAALTALPRRPPLGSDPDQWRQEVAVLRTRRHDLWLQLKPQIAARRRECSARLKSLADARYAAVADARRGSNLWWGNSNAVCAAFEVALGRLEPGGRLREQIANGGGRLTNQIIHGILALDLLSNGHAQLCIEPMPAGHRLLQRRAGRSGRDRPGDIPRRDRLRLLVATIYSRGRGTRKMARWPIILNREFPPGALIKSVAIHRRRLAPPIPAEIREWSNMFAGRAIRGNPWDWRWTATFSCEIAEPQRAASNAACGIDLGWRVIDGGVRIGTIADQSGAISHIVLAQPWLDHRVGLASLQGRARQAANQATDIGGRIAAHR